MDLKRFVMLIIKMNLVIIILDIIRSKNSVYIVLEINYVIFLEEMVVQKKLLTKRKKRNKNKSKKFNKIFLKNIMILNKIYNLLVKN